MSVAIPGRWAQLVASGHRATFFGPRGDITVGTEDVATRYGRDAAAFGPRSETVMKTLDSGAGDDIGFWVGLQRTQAHMQGQDKPVTFDHRVTKIYRREGGTTGSWCTGTPIRFRASDSQRAGSQ